MFVCASQAVLSHWAGPHHPSRQAHDIVLARGHALEWYAETSSSGNWNYDFTKHWSRVDGCALYRTYLRERITRDVVR